ncbi:hypothetical protein BGZ65_009125 [Modicella reniformis]|uniref:Uncharacterized protein n=1 Tax=Modicella reniformis TaxID=1440133 RepID=A0A9P6MKP7_9FUNG|nr:hypothetical protein BGZ65_009125 [Modicella reniformis]
MESEVIDNYHTKSQSEDGDVDINVGENAPASPLLKEPISTPSSLHNSCCSRSNTGARSSGSRSSALELQPPAPLFVGDYLFPENPSLRDLRQVFLLDKNSKQKDFRQSLQLHAHLMGLALSARVSRALDLAYDHAHDAFKNKQRPDRRNEFISAFNYSYDETERILHYALAHPQPRASFLDMMNAPSSNAILAFLHQLRTDPSILATAFRNLQSQELDTLLLPERPTVGQSSRGTRDRGYSMQTGSSSNIAQSSHAHSTPTQTMLPNFVNNQDIVHIILTTLFGPSSFEREHTLRLRTLTSIFVTLLSEKKGERTMTEILERYVVQSEWQQSGRVKARFEKSLLDIIRRGEQELMGFSDEELNANVLPLSQHHLQPFGRMASAPSMKSSTVDPTVSIHLQPGAGRREPNITPSSGDQRFHSQPELTGRQAIIEDFFTEACLEILDTLDEFSPPCLMELSQLIFAELNPSAKPYGSLIIIIKFFFYRFMNKSIAYPEARFLPGSFSDSKEFLVKYSLLTSICSF